MFGGDELTCTHITHILCFLQADADDHPVLHSDHAALRPGPHHHSRGL